MTNPVLSLKIFPHDSDFSSFEGWQPEIEQVIFALIDGYKVADMLPDFKGFTKDYNRSNWFQPLYAAALARKPLVFRFPSELADQLKKVPHWQDKLRRGFHYSLNLLKGKSSSEVKLNQPVAVEVTSQVLPLTIKDTEAYKTLMAKGYMEYTQLPDSDLSYEQFELFQKQLNKDQFNKKDGSFIASSALVNKSADDAKEIIIKLLTGVQKQSIATLVNPESNRYVYPSEKIAITMLANLRFLWQTGKELGIDVEAMFIEFDQESKHETLILVENIGSMQVRYKSGCCDIGYALPYLRQKF